MLRYAAYLLVFFSVLAGGLVPALANKRVALVIGNSAYEFAPALRNPKNDAEAITAVLERLGFDVVSGIDLTHLDFARTVGQFRKKLKGADVGLFFYAGHGLQVHGQNYLAPIDALEAVKGNKERVCQLVCGAQFNIRGAQCVKKTCRSGQKLSKRGQCLTVAVKKPRAPSVAKKKTPRKKNEHQICMEKFDWASCAHLGPRF